TIQILRGIRGPYEEHHHLVITDEALEAATHLSSRYVSERFLPDKAIDLIDESASRVRMYKSPTARLLKETVVQLRQAREAHALAIEEARFDDGQELMVQADALEEKLPQLRAGWERSDDSPRVTADDIAELVSMWTGVPVMQIAQE